MEKVEIVAKYPETKKEYALEPARKYSNNSLWLFAKKNGKTVGVITVQDLVNYAERKQMRLDKEYGDD